MNIKKGALVHLPMGVKLYQLSDSHIPVRYKTISKPISVLLMDEKNHGFCTVLYEGERWRVPAEDLYPMGEMKR